MNSFEKYNYDRAKALSSLSMVNIANERLIFTRGHTTCEAHPLVRDDVKFECGLVNIRFTNQPRIDEVLNLHVKAI